MNSRLGEDFSIDSLEQEGYDAIYLAIGAQCGSTGNIAGAEDAEGVYSAVDFLRETNAGRWTKPLGGRSSWEEASRPWTRPVPRSVWGPTR